MKIFTAEQIRQLDAYTIENEPIASIDLMERAALTFTYWFINQFPETGSPIHIFCGPGNNGGDGLAIARMLHHRFYDITVYRCHIGGSTSEDFDVNLGRLPAHGGVPVHDIEKNGSFPELPAGAILIDGIFGSGLNRPVEGFWAELLEHLNQQAATRVAIDIPSGLFADQPTRGVTFHAGHTFSFEVPKFAFFFPENQQRVGHWVAQSIGLHPEAIESTPTPYHFMDEAFIQPLLKRRDKYGHKGHFGHALLLAGSYGKMGAAVLGSRACLRAGAGLVSAHVPQCGYEIIQISVPEAMASIDRHPYQLSEIPGLEGYSAIGIGCGLGQKKATRKALLDLLKKARQPLVIDADALNILGKHPEWQQYIPEGSILTPHPKEFERLFGETSNGFERNELQRKKARELGIHIVLKGAHTCIAAPDGTCYFNGTGNPGMATAGSGDVLTGIITGILAQGYAPLEAALLGVYLHGLAGDLAAEELGQEAMIAGDITERLGSAFGVLRG
ncbi:MAG: NAD(P)H-hydrate dehydratase [Lewinellaceae bacterium]|nr:NAD(P)H-hydrate dehydratase [Phaeodactylibacter sp.]MCB0613748.1 NAD(P)H-hydrate dehydratase [Phaeodactylibacter sp.]MCB9351166.1 NAD(P)H-hydrate dehydratase [Lewinellaceae bacterium]